MDREKIFAGIRRVLEDNNLVREAYVYGSFARGEENSDSDVDLLVTFTDDASLLDIIDIKLQLQNVTDRGIDIGEKVHPLLVEQVNKEKIKIYG